jgi:hypothetical protein
MNHIEEETQTKHATITPTFCRRDTLTTSAFVAGSA